MVKFVLCFVLVALLSTGGARLHSKHEPLVKTGVGELMGGTSGEPSGGGGHSHGNNGGGNHHGTCRNFTTFEDCESRPRCKWKGHTSPSRCDVDCNFPAFRSNKTACPSSCLFSEADTCTSRATDVDYDCAQHVDNTTCAGAQTDSGVGRMCVYNRKRNECQLNLRCVWNRHIGENGDYQCHRSQTSRHRHPSRPLAKPKQN